MNLDNTKWNKKTYSELVEFLEEAINTINGAFDQKVNEEETLIMIEKNLQEDREKIIKKYVDICGHPGCDHHFRRAGFRQRDQWQENRIP